MDKILPLVFDEYVDWVVKYVPVEQQARKIVEMYEKSAEYVRDVGVVLTQLNPGNFLFLEKGIFRRFVQMLKDLAEDTDWRIGIAAPFNTDVDEPIDARTWLEFYLNPVVFTPKNIAKMDLRVCKIILAQLKVWYTTGDVPACCLINYIDQIKMVLCQSHTPEYITIFNGLAAVYESEIIADCAQCTIEGAKLKRDSTIRKTKAIKNINKTHSKQ